MASIHANTSSIHTNAGTGDRNLGSYNVTYYINSPPTADSVTPNAAAGSSQTFTLQFSDPNGYQDIGTIYFYFVPPSGANGNCAFFYDANRGGLFLFTQDFSNSYGPLAPGSSSTIQHVACSVTGTNFAVTTSGNHLTLSVPIAFKQQFAGIASIHANTSSLHTGLTTGDVTLGTYNVVFYVNSPPTADSVTPSAGGGSSQTFALQFSNPNGYQDIGTIYFYFVPPSGANGNCAFFYDATRGGLFLFTQDFSNSYGPLAPGSSSTIQHVACSVTGTNFSVTTSGNHLTLSVPITFKQQFAGKAYIHANTSSLHTGLGTGDITLGSYNVTFYINSPPTADSVTPSAAAGSSQTFTLQFSDPNGYQDINTIYFYFVPPSGANGNCAFFYDATRGGLFLFTQDFSNSYGPLAPGSSSTIQHVACSVTGTNLAVSTSGNTLTLSVPVAFKQQFAGKAYIHANTSSVHTGLGTGDVTLGTFNVTF
jgi:hypothetical protein